MKRVKFVCAINLLVDATEDRRAVLEDFLRSSEVIDHIKRLAEEREFRIDATDANVRALWATQQEILNAIPRKYHIASATANLGICGIHAKVRFLVPTFDGVDDEQRCKICLQELSKKP